MPNQKPLRVLLLIDSLTMGGAERITVALVPHFDTQRVIPIVCTMSKKGESFLGEQLGDTRRLDLESPRLLDIGSFRRLLKVVKEEKIDIIHAQLQYATVFSALARPFTGVPMVVTRHIIGDNLDNWREKTRSKIEQWSVRYATDCLVSVSEAARVYYAKVAHLPEERTRTIFNGIDVEKFTPAKDKKAKRAALNLPPDGALITMVGVMRRGKGQDVAIDAMQQLSDAHLLLVGDGESRPGLEEQARGLEDRVHFLGQRNDIPDILKASDMLILPSDSEALPTVLIEAGAAGLPAIASDVGGCAEIILHDETGYIIPRRNPGALAEAIQKLVADPKKAQAMGERACERVNQLFTLPVQAESLTQLYEEIVAKKQQ